MARMVPYLLGGLTAFLVADIVPLPSPTEHLGNALRATASAPAVALGTPNSAINRVAKGNRGAAARAADEASRIATVEVVGLRDAAIVYRDRDGRELFRTDPMSNVTLVTKGLQLPEVTVRQHTSSVVKPVAVETLQEQARDQEQVRDRKPPVPVGRKLPIGCEPMFSPVAAPSLAHHAGRCMAQVPWIASTPLG